MILLDTSVLSMALRRRRVAGDEPPAVSLLRRLIAEDVPLRVPGIVVQEVLSGMRTTEQFARLRRGLRGFPVLLAGTEDHVLAARISNACRGAGVAASTVDCLIAAVAISADAELFTLDSDFSAMASCCRLRLLPIESEPQK